MMVCLVSEAIKDYAMQDELNMKGISGTFNLFWTHWPLGDLNSILKM